MNTEKKDLFIKVLTPDEYKTMLDKRIESIYNVLHTKSKEYVRNGDRLHNFHKASMQIGLNRERALDGFLLKHYVSYRDFLDDLDAGKIPSEEQIKEKFGDIINYFILQEMQFLQRAREEHGVAQRKSES